MEISDKLKCKVIGLKSKIIELKKDEKNYIIHIITNELTIDCKNKKLYDKTHNKLEKDQEIIIHEDRIGVYGKKGYFEIPLDE